MTQTTTSTIECSRHPGEFVESTSIAGMRFWMACPKCLAEREASDDAERVRVEEAQSKREIDRLEAMGIRRRFYATTFDTFRTFSPEMEAALFRCREYAARREDVLESGESLFLLGRPGTGKNHLAVAILKEFRSGRIVKAAEMVREVRESYRSGCADTEQGLIERFAAYDILIVNEIGVQFGTDNERNLIFEVLDLRYENMAPTICISNFNLQGIKDFLGGRVIDRMLENGSVIDFTWGSYRAEKKE